MTSCDSSTDSHHILLRTDNMIEEAIILKRRRNCSIPISRLPTEILSTIFLHVAMDGQTEYKFCFKWVSITYVCHFWREVTLNSALLWSFWGIPNSQWMETFFSRSRQVPLYIRRFELSDSYAKALIELLQRPSCRDRVRELHLAGPGSYLTEILDVFAATSPISVSDCPLRSILIIPVLSYQPTILDSAFWLPNTFLGLRFPHLRQLRLCNCLFDWNSTIFFSSVLVHLAITVPDEPVTYQPTTAQILSILANQPLLEEFDLQCDHVTHTDYSEVVSVDLPRLRSIRIESSASGCFTLMTRLSYPRAGVEVIITLLSDVEGDFDSHALPFFKHYGANWNCDSPPIIEELHMSCDAIMDVLCRPCSKPIDIDKHSVRQSPRFIIGRSRYEMKNPNPRLLSVACLALPLHNLRKFTCAGTALKSTQFRLNVFGAMNNLEELELSVPGVWSAIIALNPDRNKKTHDSDSEFKLERAKVTSPVLLPKLRKLQISDAMFYRPLKHLPLDVRLVSCLEPRKRANHALDLLILRSCSNVGPAEVEGYNKYVKEVDWDGFVDYWDDSDDPGEEDD